ncbi:MAG: hypothetical protein JWN48_5885 [Myxococcaceae bacterium]|nr:hypothetical protein [Myxococcaceae bacterium]
MWNVIPLEAWRVLALGFAAASLTVLTRELVGRLQSTLARAHVRRAPEVRSLRMRGQLSSTAGSPVRPRRASLARLLVVAAVVLACSGLALRAQPTASPPSSPGRPEQPTALPALAASCRLRGDEAVAHASSLEQVARARWQRVPFALGEAPRAAAQMAEAEACYEAARDREGRMRSGAAKRAYEAELQRRFSHASLLLRATHGARGTDDRTAQHQVESLLALLERAPASADSYRRELTRLARSYAASSAERERVLEEQP